MDDELIILVNNFHIHFLAIRKIGLALTSASALYLNIFNGEEPLLRDEIATLKERGLIITENVEHHHFFVYESEEDLQKGNHIQQPTIDDLRVEGFMQALLDEYR